MKQILNSLALFGAVALCGCSTVNVATDTDPSAPIGTYRTYALKSPERGGTLSPAVDAALRDSLRENLAARGIREVSANEPADLAVIPQASIHQQQSVVRYNDWAYGFSTGGGYFYPRYGLWPSTKVESYTEDRLLLDFVDTSSQKVVLRGQVAQDLTGREKNAANIEAAVKKVVAALPAVTAQYAAQ